MSKNMLSSVNVRILSHVQTIWGPCLAQRGQMNLAEQQVKCKIQYIPQTYRIHSLNKEHSLERNQNIVRGGFSTSWSCCAYFQPHLSRKQSIESLSMSQEASHPQMLQQNGSVSTQTYATTANLVARILSLWVQRDNLGWVLVQLAWKMNLEEYMEFKIIRNYIVRVKWVIPLHRYSFIFWICLIGYFSLPKTLIIQISLQNKKAVPQNKQRRRCQKPPLEANTQHVKN